MYIVIHKVPKVPLPDTFIPDKEYKYEDTILNKCNNNVFGEGFTRK